MDGQTLRSALSPCFTVDNKSEMVPTRVRGRFTWTNIISMGSAQGLFLDHGFEHAGDGEFYTTFLIPPSLNFMGQGTKRCIHRSSVHYIKPDKGPHRRTKQVVPIFCWRARICFGPPIIPTSLGKWSLKYQNLSKIL